MNPHQFFDAVRDLVFFVQEAPCCDKPDPNYGITVADEYTVVTCVCGATWAVEVGGQKVVFSVGDDVSTWTMYTAITDEARL